MTDRDPSREPALDTPDLGPGPEPPAPVRRRYSLPQRIILTIRYRGVGQFVYRALTFPLRYTRYRDRLGLVPKRPDLGEPAREWYRRNARPVAIVIPSYRDLPQVRDLVASLRETTDERRVQIIVADDASGPDHVSGLRDLAGVTVVEGARNGGFSANVNRGMKVADPERDIVLLNSDMVALPGWLEGLQYAAHQGDDVGLVGGKLLYENNAIQWAGTVRHRDQPQWFDHRFRFRPADWPPAGVPTTVLALTGACMYIKREVIEKIGWMDEGYSMAYEDVDYSLRVWQSRLCGSIYWPSSRAASTTSRRRGGPRSASANAESQQLFLGANGARSWTARDVRDLKTGHLRVVYVTEDTGVGGGHRDIFEHLNRLAAPRPRGGAVVTGARAPEWFDLDVPVRQLRQTTANWSTALDAESGRSRSPPGGEHGRPRLGGQRGWHGHSGLLRPGHRDQLLPRQASSCADGGARVLSARVSTT